MKMNKNKKVKEDIKELIEEVSEVKEEIIDSVEPIEVEEEVKEKPKKKAVNPLLTLEEKIDNWKIKHDEIFETTISGQNFIWKPLTRTEYKEGYKIEGDRDMFIIKAACLYPSENEIEEIVERKGGISFVLTEIILSESGFNVEGSKRL